MSTDKLLVMEGICKAFHNVKVLENVEFSLNAGEIHSLMGENGAGKSTLMKILCGTYSCDSGEIFIDGVRVRIASPADAKRYGIGIVHQELILAPHLTVAENIYIGREPKGFAGTLSQKKLNQQAKRLLEELQIPISPDEQVRNLTVAQKQLVEIAKVISQSPKILIMDEPTSALPESEVSQLLSRVRQLKERGIGIIYISHKMNEIKKISDRVTVLRDGTHIGTLKKEEIDIQKIIEMMVGRIGGLDFHRKRKNVSEECVMRVEHLTNENIQDVSFYLKKGEILGFSGLMGAGRSETMRALFGMDPVIKGELFINNRKQSVSHPQQLVRNGVGFAPEDRKEQALFLDMPVWSNISIAQLYHAKWGIRNIKKERLLGEKYRERLRIQASSVSQMVKRLSGGNQQKVVISRWLANHPDILILDEPTRGIDVGAKTEIYEILSELSEKGMSIIIVSSEITELLSIADRIIIMHEGKISGELSIEEATQEKIMTFATGQKM